MAHSLVALLLFQALIFVVASMIVVWFWSVKIKNASIVDIAWAGLFSFIILLYAVIGDGYEMRKITIAIMVCTWSGRLTLFLYRRILGSRGGPQGGHRGRPFPEDARYAKLRELWHPNSEMRFLYFFELQGLLLVLLTIPFALICMNTTRELSFFEIAATFVWLAALVGESIADQQLSKFKNAKENLGKTCDVGLWKYSRHPNYFCEWLIWISYSLFSLSSDWGWISIFCPVLMYLLLTRVTGIPMAEEQSLKSRGDEYRNYQKRTNAFFPWLPKKT